MAEAVATFMQACGAMQAPATFQAASEYLTKLRDSADSSAVAKAVLELPEATAAVHMQAVLLLRDATMKHWSSFSAAQQRDLREWCMFYAARLASAGSWTPLLGQMLVVIAVFWKRGWLEISKEERHGHVEQIVHLFDSGNRQLELLGAKLCTTLIQEFDLSNAPGSGGGKASSRYTALGVPLTFHTNAASAFQEGALLPLFNSTCERLLAAAAPLVAGSQAVSSVAVAGVDYQLLQALLGVLCDALAWDFVGSRRGASIFRSAGATRSLTTIGTPVRIHLPAAWQRLLHGHAAETLLRAVAAVYSAARPRAGTAPFDALAQQARATIAHLCAVGEPQAPLDGVPAAPPPSPRPLPYSAACASMLASLLQAPLLDRIAELVAAGAGEEAASEAAYAEVRDLCVSAVALLSNAGPLELHAAGLTASALQPLCQAVYEATQKLTGSIQATAGLVDAAAAAGSADADPRRLRSAVEGVAAFLEEKYAPLCVALDACIDFWKTACADLAELGDAEAAASAGLPGASTLPGAEGLTAESAALLGMVRGAVAGVYAGVVRSRVAMETAIVRCGINNDNPMDDVSALVDQEESLAALGRLVPAQAVECVLAELGAAFGQLQAHTTGRSGLARASGELSVEGAASCEALWWLVGFATYLLADDPSGEAPMVPACLNTLSKSANRSLHAMAAGAGATHAETGAALISRELQASSDPVAKLVCAVFSVGHYEASRLMSAKGRQPGSMSPLLFSRLLWSLGRLSSSYLMPDLSLYSRTALAPALSACFAVDPADFAAVDAAIASAAAAAPGNPAPCNSATGMLVVPASPELYGGGRSLLELVLQCGAAALASAWGATEPIIADKAVHVFRVIARTPGPARWCVMSPTWSVLVASFSKVVGGEDPSAALAEAGPLADVWSAHCPLAAPQLGQLAGMRTDAQRDLLAALLSVVRSVGEEVPHALLAVADAGSRALVEHGSVDAVAAAGAPAEMLGVLRRWQAYYECLVTPLQARLGAVLASPQFCDAAAAPVVVGELERLLQLHIGVLRGHSSRLPHAWHIHATARALVACDAIVRGQRATGRAVIAALEFLREFLEPDASPMPHLAAGEVEAVFKAIAAVFEAYAAVHAGRLAALAATSPAAAAADSSRAAAKGQGGAGSTRSGGGGSADLLPSRAGSSAGAGGGGAVAAVIAAREEEEVCDDVRLLLDILQRILSLEDINFLTSTADDAAAAAAAGGEEPDDRRTTRAATQALVVGLSFIIPVMSGGLLQFPALAGAYVAVVSGLLCGHPQQVAALDHGMFATLVSSLEFGLRHVHDDIVLESLQALKALAEYHVSCRAGGFAVLPGMHPQLAAMPDLWGRLLGALLGLLVGPLPPSAAVIPAAADALVSVIAADPDAFKANVLHILSMQPSADMAARLSAEFHALTTAHGVDVMALNRRTKLAFRDNAEAFVKNVRAFTTIE